MRSAPSVCVLHWSQSKLGSASSYGPDAVTDSIMARQADFHDMSLVALTVTETCGDDLTKIAQRLSDAWRSDWMPVPYPGTGQGTGIAYDSGYWDLLPQSDAPFGGLAGLLPLRRVQPHSQVALVRRAAPHYQLALLCVHFPSRTAPSRTQTDRTRLMAEVQRSWLSYREAQPSMRLLVLGDLNDEPWSPSVRHVLSRPQRGRTEPEDELVAIMGRLEADRRFVGTYRARDDVDYERRWYTLDGVLASGAMLNEYKGLGRGFVVDEAATGVLDWREPSDHLPILVALCE